MFQIYKKYYVKNQFNSYFSRFLNIQSMCNARQTKWMQINHKKLCEKRWQNRSHFVSQNANMNNIRNGIFHHNNRKHHPDTMGISTMQISISSCVRKMNNNYHFTIVVAYIAHTTRREHHFYICEIHEQMRLWVWSCLLSQCDLCISMCENSCEWVSDARSRRTNIFWWLRNVNEISFFFFFFLLPNSSRES